MKKGGHDRHEYDDRILLRLLARTLPLQTRSNFISSNSDDDMAARSRGAGLDLTNRETSAPSTPGDKVAVGVEPVFAGMVFAFAGRFSAAQNVLKGWVEGGGGSCAASVTLKVTHVITTKAAVNAEKRSAAIATAIGRGLPLLSEDFLARCVEERKLLDMQEFNLCVVRSGPALCRKALPRPHVAQAMR